MAKGKKGKKRNTAKQRKKSRKIRTLVLIVFYVLVLTAGFVIAYKYAVDSTQNRSKTTSVDIDPEDRIVVNIPLGSSTDDIVNILKKEGIIKYPVIYKIISNLEGFDGKYKCGNHILSENLKHTDIMKILIKNPEAVKVTFPEGYTFGQITDKLDRLKLIDFHKFEQTAETEDYDYKALKDIPDRRDPDLEGYLFPDTYEFDSRTGEKEIIRRMLKRFDDIFKPEYYEKAKKLEMSVDDIVILASIIEKEARVADERAMISGVFYNRLKGDDSVPNKLESCATIQYIFYRNEGKIKEVITNEDIDIDNPYNTYKYEGLPPGPICCPGKASLEAALNPAKHDYYYFVTKGDGTHHFSKTLNEHKMAMKKYGIK